MTEADNAHGSTLVGVADRLGRRGRLGRRAFLMLLTIVVALGASGLLGVRTATARTAADGWTLEVTYARIARASLDVPWRVTVRHPGGFAKDSVTLRVSARYFDIFETQAFHPAPAEESADGEFLLLTFDVAPGATEFAVDYDAYIQPASQLGRRAEVCLMDEDRIRLSLRYRTWLLP